MPALITGTLLIATIVTSIMAIASYGVVWWIPVVLAILGTGSFIVMICSVCMGIDLMQLILGDYLNMYQYFNYLSDCDNITKQYNDL